MHTLISLINVGPTLTDFEKFHPPQNKNPPYTFIDFLDFSTLHSRSEMGSEGCLELTEPSVPPVLSPLPPPLKNLCITDGFKTLATSEDLKSLNDDTLSAGKLLLVGIDPSDKEQQYHYPRVRLCETLGTVGEWYSPQEY